MNFLDPIPRLHEIKNRAEHDFCVAVEMKNPTLIASAMDRLNQIDRAIIAHEYRAAEWKRELESKADWNSEQNKRIEEIRQNALAYLRISKD